MSNIQRLSKPRLRRLVYGHLPFLLPLRIAIYKIIHRPNFSGWGMTSRAALPWVDPCHWQSFRDSDLALRSNFEHGLKLETGVDGAAIAGLSWRHWIVAFAVRYAISHTRKGDSFDLVECGVGDGVTAFVALSEAQDYKLGDPDFEYSMQCYDAWSPMHASDLLPREITHSAGAYLGASLDRTKRNLQAFGEQVSYHQGHIPESLTANTLPESIRVLSVDLNSANATVATLDICYSRVAENGVIVFDDYGNPTYADTKTAVDSFFSTRPGILLKLPTGQAIYFKSRGMAW